MHIERLSIMSEEDYQNAKSIPGSGSREKLK